MNNSSSSMENKQARQFPVRNAGLVILQSYFTELFEKLGLMTEHKFHNDGAQEAAIHYLHYLVTGLENSEDPELVLNKVLCGMEPSQTIEYGITISEEKKHLIESFIKSAMNYWPGAGCTSVNGFRGNWLVRNGMLTEQEDRWELKVEHHGYDVLLNRSPFSFSLVKLPWMQKPLYVTWP